MRGLLLAMVELSEVTRRIRRVQRRLQDSQRRSDDVGGRYLSARTTSLVLMVHSFSCWDLDTAATFMAFRTKCGRSECDMDVCRCLVEKVFIEDPTQSLVKLMNDQCLEAWSMQFLAAAALFVLQFRLYRWLCVQMHGVAPSRLQMIQCSVTAGRCALPRHSAGEAL